MVYKISRPQALRVAIFFKMSSIGHLVFNGFFPKGNQIITNTQRTTTSNLNVIQPAFHKISRPHAFWAAIFSKYPVSHLAFNNFFPKVNQIIRNNQQTTTSNLNAIQPTVHMISRPQALWADIFSKCTPSTILFLMNSSQKLIRSSEITREPPIKFACNPFKG